MGKTGTILAIAVVAVVAAFLLSNLFTQTSKQQQDALNEITQLDNQINGQTTTGKLSDQVVQQIRARMMDLIAYLRTQGKKVCRVNGILTLKSLTEPCA